MPYLANGRPPSIADVRVFGTRPGAREMSQTVTMKPRSGRQLDKRRALVVYVVQQESWGVPCLFAEVWVSPKKSLLVTTYGGLHLSLIHISEPTRQAEISYAVF